VVTVDVAARLGALSGDSGTGLACGRLNSPKVCVFGLYWGAAGGGRGGRIQSALGQFWVGRTPPRLGIFRPRPRPALLVGWSRCAAVGGESIPQRDMVCGECIVCGECGKLSDGTLNAHPRKRPVEPHSGPIQFARTPIGRRWTFNRSPHARGAVANRSPTSGQPNNERANRVPETGNGAGTVGESMHTSANPTKPTSYSVN
jgi:hypothetical protein